MDYIVNTAFGCHIYQKEDIVFMGMNAFTYIKKLCHQHLFTYSGYLEACRKTLALKYKIPLYIKETIQLIAIKSVRSYDNIWINYAYISSYKAFGKGVTLVFYDGRTLYANLSIDALKTQIKRLNLIKEVKVKHFHV